MENNQPPPEQNSAREMSQLEKEIYASAQKYAQARIMEMQVLSKIIQVLPSQAASPLANEVGRVLTAAYLFGIYESSMNIMNPPEGTNPTIEERTQFACDCAKTLLTAMGFQFVDTDPTAVDPERN